MPVTARKPVSPKLSPAGKTLDPVAYTTTITTRQPDGSMVVRAGKPVILNGEDEISTAEAARILACQVN